MPKMVLTGKEFAAIVGRANSPFSTLDHRARLDLQQLIMAVREQAKRIQQLEDDVRGQSQTLMVIVRELGPIEVSFADVASIHPDDTLVISDVDTDDGRVRVFGFEAHTPDA